jgi:hypothetical protein
VLWQSCTAPSVVVEQGAGWQLDVPTDAPAGSTKAPQHACPGRHSSAATQVRLGSIPELDPPKPPAEANEPPADTDPVLLHDTNARDQSVPAVTRNATRRMEGAVIGQV